MKYTLYGNERILIKMAVLAFLAELSHSEDFVELLTDDVMLPLVKDALETPEAKMMADYWEENPKELFELAINTMKKLK